MGYKNILLVLVTICFLAACNSSPLQQTEPTSGNVTLIKRVFNPTNNGTWIGNGISYGAYRDGEGPDKGILISKEHILEDLQLIAQRWNLIRMYAADQQSRNILEVIRDNRLPIRVMQGAWLSEHQTDAQNNTQVDQLTDLANTFPESIISVNLGNEIFVDWSAQ